MQKSEVTGTPAGMTSESLDTNQLSLRYPLLPHPTPQHCGGGMQQPGECICVHACVHMCASACVCRWQGAATHRMAVRCGALSQDSPGPAKRAPGVCLQEPRGAAAVGASPPPTDTQSLRGLCRCGGSGQVSEDRLS